MINIEKADCKIILPIYFEISHFVVAYPKGGNSYYKKRITIGSFRIYFKDTPE
jgi:hypothetical protein